MEKILGFLVIGIGLAGFVVLLGLLMGYPTMWAWNHVVPSLFGLREINFWDAFCLNFLAGTFFKSSSSSSSK